jgi:hypothetical protein
MAILPSRRGSFGISLLRGLGLQVRNRYGLRPEKLPDGSPAPLEIAAEFDRSGLMEGVTAFNLHAQPHLEARQSWTCWHVNRSIPGRRRIPLRREAAAISTPCCNRSPAYFAAAC